eukprot:TRINITY_DN25015_c0_g2_i1.p1 TRINITY_DN25015_c0_g2~~TRINITY_DN25015_c0_g2_i1.p1  ORF type:complete len:990 (-),score=66.89 TRINITY_DN25015_c0_g2_i1:146-2731(-)
MLVAVQGHPNVVEFHGLYLFNNAAQSLGIAQTWYSGSDLLHELELGPSTEQRALAIMLDVCRGLDHVHSRRIVHRDIKAENVFRTSDRCVVGDFGIAMLESDLCYLSDRMGTLGYIAPEVIDVGHGTRSYPLDIFSCGVLLYYVLSCRLPFGNGAKDPVRTAALTMAGTIKFRSARFFNVSQWTRRLIARMCSSKPCARPTAEDVCTLCSSIMSSIHPASSSLSVDRHNVEGGSFRDTTIGESFLAEPASSDVDRKQPASLRTNIGDEQPQFLFPDVPRLCAVGPYPQHSAKENIICNTTKTSEATSHLEEPLLPVLRCAQASCDGPDIKDCARSTTTSVPQVISDSRHECRTDDAGDVSAPGGFARSCSPLQDIAVPVQSIRSSKEASPDAPPRRSMDEGADIKLAAADPSAAPPAHKANASDQTRYINSPLFAMRCRHTSNENRRPEAGCSDNSHNPQTESRSTEQQRCDSNADDLNVGDPQRDFEQVVEPYPPPQVQGTIPRKCNARNRQLQHVKSSCVDEQQLDATSVADLPTHVAASYSTKEDFGSSMMFAGRYRFHSEPSIFTTEGHNPHADQVFDSRPENKFGLVVEHDSATTFCVDKFSSEPVISGTFSFVSIATDSGGEHLQIEPQRVVQPHPPPGPAPRKFVARADPNRQMRADESSNTMTTSSAPMAKLPSERFMSDQSFRMSEGCFQKPSFFVCSQPGASDKATSRSNALDEFDKLSFVEHHRFRSVQPYDLGVDQCLSADGMDEVFATVPKKDARASEAISMDASRPSAHIQTESSSAAKSHPSDIRICSVPCAESENMRSVLAEAAVPKSNASSLATSKPVVLEATSHMAIDALARLNARLKQGKDT